MKEKKEERKKEEERPLFYIFDENLAPYPSPPYKNS
jgi:hypothetical protein